MAVQLFYSIKKISEEFVSTFQYTQSYNWFLWKILYYISGESLYSVTK